MHSTSFSIKWFINCLLIFLNACLQGEEQLFCLFDDRAWQIGFEAEIQDEKITELILQNENIMNWNELFTVQLFLGFPLSASDFVTVLERSSKESLPTQEDLEFKIIEKDPLDIFESSFIFNQNQEKATIANNEYNVGRVIKGKTTLYYLRYSTKDVNLFKQNKDAWIKRLKLAYVASAPKENSQGKWMVFNSNGIYEEEKQLTHQNEYQFIDNQNAGYSLSLPKNWTFRKVEKSKHVDDSFAWTDSLVFFSSDQSIEGKVMFRDLPEESSLKAISQKYYEIYKKQHPQTQVIGEGKIQTIVGQNAHYLILISGDKKGWITLMCINKRFYCLELWTKSTQFNDLKTTLKNIIMNFQTRSFHKD